MAPNVVDWTVLDFGSIEKSLASRLTDDDIEQMLLLIDAANVSIASPFQDKRTIVVVVSERSCHYEERKKIPDSHRER